MADLIVIGAGHAGCEAALAAARMGIDTLLLTLNMDGVALMACNPVIGGSAKGHLVRELDALGGEMGLAIDDTFLQSRMLNMGKGPAVHSLRAQADKQAYQNRMRRALMTCEHLTVRQGEAASIETENNRVTAVTTVTGARIPCRAVVAATGVYLKGSIIIGEHRHDGGPQGLMNAGALSASLLDLGFELRRFKTGTPARVDVRTIDFDEMQEQKGDEPVVPFSFLTDRKLENTYSCYLTWTTPETHRIILDNLDRAPLYSGKIHGIGPRYCPSIEDKVVRFADKDRHQIFLEPEGKESLEWYVQGMSTSMPEDVQWAMYRINGTSGYEEAACQGLLAGMNAALQIQGKAPVLLTRDQAYIGVLTDDLTTKGTDEPYRMMTSRAEHRLYLRQDNADLRLTEIGFRAGLASAERMERTRKKQEETEQLIRAMKTTRFAPGEALNGFLRGKGQPETAGSLNAEELLRRPEVSFRDLQTLKPEWQDASPAAAEQAEIAVKYAGYLEKQAHLIEQARRMEETRLPEDIPYDQIVHLRLEARQKLARQKPVSLAAAGRIPGVNPADVAVLTVWLEKQRRSGEKQ